MARLLAVLGVVLPLAGFASPNPVLYTLEPRPGPVFTSLHRLVAVRGVDLPRYLERQEVVRSANGGRLVVSNNDWWGEPLRDMLPRIVVADLAQWLLASDVVADNVPAGAQPDAEVEVDVERFEGDGAGNVVLAGHVGVETKGRPRTLDRLDIRLPLGGRTVGDQVGAMSAAIGEAANIVARHLAPSPVPAPGAGAGGPCVHHAPPFAR